LTLREALTVFCQDAASRRPTLAKNQLSAVGWPPKTCFNIHYTQSILTKAFPTACIFGHQAEKRRMEINLTYDDRHYRHQVSWRLRFSDDICRICCLFYYMHFYNHFRINDSSTSTFYYVWDLFSSSNISLETSPKRLWVTVHKLRGFFVL